MLITFILRNNNAKELFRKGKKIVQYINKTKYLFFVLKEFINFSE